MNRNIIFVILGLIVIVAGGAWALVFVLSGSGSEAAATSLGSLSAEETFFDFGEITMANGKVTHSFEVKNNGTEPLRINKVYTSCMCTTASVIDSLGKKRGVFGMPGHTSSSADIKVGVGETIRVDAIFDPNAHGPSGVGLMERSIYVETNSSESPQLELSFRAVVAK